MSEITEPRGLDATLSNVAPDVTSEVPGYQHSSSLEALQELVDVAGQVPHEAEDYLYTRMAALIILLLTHSDRLA